MSVSPEIQRNAFAALATLFFDYESYRNSRSAPTTAATAYRNELVAKYHGALDMYALFTGQEDSVVHDEILEWYAYRIEMGGV